jgi:hypothetical protein
LARAQLVWSWTQAGVLIQVSTGTAPPLLPLADARAALFELLCGAADASTSGGAAAATSCAVADALRAELRASCAKADAAVAAKRDAEGELYRKFACVLNTKKALICELTAQRDDAAQAADAARARVARLEARRGAERTAAQEEEEEEEMSDGQTPNASDADADADAAGDAGGSDDSEEEEEVPVQLTQPRRAQAAAPMPPSSSSRLLSRAPAARGAGMRIKQEAPGGASAAQPARTGDSGASQRARTQSVRAHAQRPLQLLCACSLVLTRHGTLFVAVCVTHARLAGVRCAGARCLAAACAGHHRPGRAHGGG